MKAAMTAAYGLVAILLIAGLLGSILPFLPGTPLILAGTLLYAVVTDFDPIGMGRLLILAGIAALAYGLDYLAGAFGVKKLGGGSASRRTVGVQTSLMREPVRPALRRVPRR